MKPSRKSSSPAPAPAVPETAESSAEGKHVLSPAEVTALNETARLYPWTLFSIGELAAMLRRSVKTVSAVANYWNSVDNPAPEKIRHYRPSPFQAGKFARPEKVADFLQNPPSDFALK